MTARAGWGGPATPVAPFPRSARTSPMTTGSGLFDSHEAAAASVRELESLGIASNDISMVGPDRGGRATDEPRSFGAKGDHVAADAGQGAEIGGAVGAVGGLLAGLGMLAITGIGPVVAARWLVSTQFVFVV